MRYAFLIVLALVGCAPRQSPPEKDRMAPELPHSAGHDSEVVAIIDGTPVTWREVAEKAMELDLKNAVDLYVKWKTMEDLKKKHGISHTPEELHARSKALLDQWRKFHSDEELKMQLEKQKLTEEEYVERYAKSGLLSGMLDLEKLFRYSEIAEGSIEIDRMIFVDEAEANAFVEDMKAKGFDKTVEEWGKRPMTKRIGRNPREVFTPSTVPPQIDDYISAELFSMKAGEVTGVKISHQSGRCYVIKVTARKLPRPVPYAEVKDEIFRGILAEPPAEQEYTKWFEGVCRRVKVLYENKGRGK